MRPIFLAGHTAFSKNNRLGKTYLLILALLALAVSSGCACNYTQEGVERSQVIKYGPGFFLYKDKTIPQDSAMRVYYYKPKGFTPDSPIFLVLHGYGRNAKRMMRTAAETAEAYNYLLVAPEYSFDLFPTAEEYNYGNARKKPKELWAFLVNDRIFELVKKLTDSRQEKYYLYGHSAGSQFVHRQLIIGASDHVEMAFAANAGQYAMPEAGEAPFPWSLTGLDLSRKDLAKLFSLNLYVLLGENDVEQGRYLPKGNIRDKQGPNRLARGKKFYKTGKKQAKKLGLDFNWKLVTVPDVGHSTTEMFPVALGLAFGQKK